jgi:hypothetical protein
MRKQYIRLKSPTLYVRAAGGLSGGHPIVGDYSIKEFPGELVPNKKGRLVEGAPPDDLQDFAGDFARATSRLERDTGMKRWENVVICCHGHPGILRIYGDVDANNVSQLASVLRGKVKDIWLVACNVAASQKLGPLLGAWDHGLRGPMGTVLSQAEMDRIDQIAFLAREHLAMVDGAQESPNHFCSRLARATNANVWASPHAQGVPVGYKAQKNKLEVFEGRLYKFAPHAIPRLVMQTPIMEDASKYVKN